jgi:hypothetical protein
VPQIAGTYAGPTTDSSISPPVQIPLWTIKFARPNDNIGWRFKGCSGETLAVQQASSSFTGSFTQGGNCTAVAGVLTSGSVKPDGAVTFSLVGPASDPLAWTGFSQCVMTVGSPDFTGTVSGGLFDASFAHDASMQCPNEGTILVNVRLRGTR